MTSSFYQVTKTYDVVYKNPIQLRVGDTVKILKKENNPEWLGWVFCRNESAHEGLPEDLNEGWVSETYLDINGSEAKVIRDYDATELAVEEREYVESLKQEFGWAWVRKVKSSGEKNAGWVPLNQLNAISYYAVLFSSKRTELHTEAYEEISKKMVSLAMLQPGYLGIESARNSDGSGITISYWASMEAIQNWKHHSEHVLAQKFGREKAYSEFKVKICRVNREYAFN